MPKCDVIGNPKLGLPPTIRLGLLCSFSLNALLTLSKAASFIVLNPPFSISLNIAVFLGSFAPILSNSTFSSLYCFLTYFYTFSYLIFFFFLFLFISLCLFINHFLYIIIFLYCF